jgi:uncharacterized protein YlzI (FlbEa/FlbD family)
MSVLNTLDRIKLIEGRIEAIGKTYDAYVLSINGEAALVNEALERLEQQLDVLDKKIVIPQYSTGVKIKKPA